MSTVTPVSLLTQDSYSGSKAAEAYTKEKDMVDADPWPQQVVQDQSVKGFPVFKSFRLLKRA